MIGRITHSKRVLLCAMICLTITLTSATTTMAYGSSLMDDRPAVVIVDSSLGDLPYYSSNWLGDKTSIFANDGDLVLKTATSPVWWQAGEAPETYLLGNTKNGAVTASEIVWAIDRIDARYPRKKIVLVAQGSAGIQARLYAQDLTNPTQSSRADLVGLVLLGTPNNGLSVASEFPHLSFWEPYAAGSGLTVDDLLPESDLLQALNAGSLPNVVRPVAVQGVATDLGFGLTDGFTVSADSSLTTKLSDSIEAVQVKATGSQGMNLSTAWSEGVKSGSPYANLLDQKAIETIGLKEAYATSDDVLGLVKKYYSAWYAKKSPTTHLSTTLVLDVSGSMLEKVSSRYTKLDASKIATEDFLQSMDTRDRQSFAVPEDVSIIAFNTQATEKSSSSIKGAKKAVKALRAGGNTDVGKALEKAVSRTEDAPTCADKRILFLSDGLNTVGLDERGILAGPVAEAKKSGIRIDTIAFGSVKLSDTAFLKRIAARTGGKFYKSQGLFELRRDFLKARYSTLGTLLLDEDLPSKSGKNMDIGTVEPGTVVLEVGVIAEGKVGDFTIVCDGKTIPLKKMMVAKGSDGMVSLTLKNPTPGGYTISFDKRAGRLHAFAVAQSNPFQSDATELVTKDYSMFVLLGLGALTLLGVGFCIANRISHSNRNQATDNSSSTFDTDASEGEISILATSGDNGGE